MAEQMTGMVDAEDGDTIVVDGVEMTAEQLREAKAKAEEEQRQRAERINAMGLSLAKTRSEAIAARQASGIEDIWLEDDEFYEGIDEANRGESRSNFRTKPPGQASEPRAKSTQSTIFPNITGPFCDAAAARISDMLLPTDDRAWGLKPTPIPEMEGLSKGEPGMMREAQAAYQNQPEMALNALAQAVQDAAEVMEEAKLKADKAQKRIEDWHVECQFHAQVRLVIEDAARAGAGVIKGPVPVVKRRAVYRDGTLSVSKEIKPGSKWVDFWNFFPDPACGENIHNGSYIWERDYLTKKQLRELRDQEGYITDQVDACLEEGATRAEGTYRETLTALTDPEQKDKFEVWYYHGTIERDDIEAAGCNCEDANDPHVPAMVVMVNNRVIKAALNPLDTGDFPYDVMVWRRRSGHWAGCGVARQIRTPQRMITAAARHLMDNAGIAAGTMLVFRHGVVSADGKPLGIGPRRLFVMGEDADEIGDATKAIGQIKVDMVVEELLKIIELGMKFAEDVTGLPMLLQGQMGAAPDTVGGMTMLNNNASSVLRRLARLFDDRITEPHVRRYYHWLLQYGEDDEKGDYCIDARGSSALVERDLQNQQLPQLLQVSLNPLFGWDPKKAGREWLKGLHFDPKSFEFEDDDWKKIVQNMSKGPQDPRMAVAELRAASEDREREFKAALTMLEQRFDEQENQKDREADLMVEAVQAELERAAQTGERAMSFDNIKATLASTVMKLRVQRDMAANDRQADAKLTMKPPVEPHGKARPGRSFQA